MRTFTNPKSGESVESHFSNAEALAKLYELDQPSLFVSDLIKVAEKGQPSPAQEFWIHKKALGDPVIDVGDAYSVISGYFEKARASGLRFPRLTFDYRKAGGNKLVISSSRDPAVVLVKRNDKFMGRITPQGFVPSGPVVKGVVSFITLIGLDAFSVVTLYGLKTGSCCFCARHLSTMESVAVGYGPICAERYGLPWGVERASSKLEIGADDA